MSSDNNAAEIARLLRQINQVSNDIAKYQNARTKVVTVKNSGVNGRQNWETTHNKLRNNSDLSTVKKTDQFEGEMADKLKGFMQDVINEINNAIARLVSLESSLNSQVTRLDNKITELKNRKISLQNQLSRLY